MNDSTTRDSGAGGWVCRVCCGCRVGETCSACGGRKRLPEEEITQRTSRRHRAEKGGNRRTAYAQMRDPGILTQGDRVQMGSVKMKISQDCDRRNTAGTACCTQTRAHQTREGCAAVRLKCDLCLLKLCRFSSFAYFLFVLVYSCRRTLSTVIYMLSIMLINM